MSADCIRLMCDSSWNMINLPYLTLFTIVIVVIIFIISFIIKGPLWLLSTLNGPWPVGECLMNVLRSSLWRVWCHNRLTLTAVFHKARCLDQSSSLPTPRTSPLSSVSTESGTTCMQTTSSCTLMCPYKILIKHILHFKTASLMSAAGARREDCS